MEREDLYRKHLRNSGVSSDSIESYVHYINRVSEITGTPINFNTLFDESCVDRILNIQRRTGKNNVSIYNYQSALRKYVDMVNHIQNGS